MNIHLTETVRPALAPRGGARAFYLAMMGGVALGGCAANPPLRSGALSDYSHLARSDGLLTTTEMRVDKVAVTAVKTVAIARTRFSDSAISPPLTAKQRALVANAIDRAVCSALAERFVIVSSTMPADLVVKMVVTKLTPTDAAMAAVSRAASFGGSFVSVPVPRLPIGLGGLSVEAEAIDRAGRQQAAFVWRREADMITSKARVSDIGDAYQLADEFGADFGKLLTTGSDPMKPGMSMPSLAHISSSVTGEPKQASCAVYGRGSGLIGVVAGFVGTPPEWGDDGQATAPAPSTTAIP